MSTPIFLHSAMAGAPQLKRLVGNFNALLDACLVNGFNVQSVVSATCASGVTTFNFASAPGFSAADTVTVEGASNALLNGRKSVQSAGSNQVLVATPGVPDGAVGGTITLKFRPLGWTRPYSGENVGCYRQGGGEAFHRFLRVDDSLLSSAGGGYGYFRAYEDMTDVDTGTGPFPTPEQVSGSGCSVMLHRAYAGTGITTPVPWVVVGTPRFFYVMVNAWFNANNVASNGLAPIWSIPAGSTYGTLTGYCFGDLAAKAKVGDIHHTVLQAAENKAWCVGTGGAYIARDASGVAGSKLVNGFSPTNHLTGASYNLPFPSPTTGGMTLLGPPRLLDSAGGSPFRGFMPGMLCPLEGPYSQAAGMPERLMPGQVVHGVDGVAGRVILMLSTSSTAADMLLALDEDWGDE